MTDPTLQKLEELLIRTLPTGGNHPFDIEIIKMHEVADAVFTTIFKGIPSNSSIGFTNLETVMNLIERAIFKDLQLIKHRLQKKKEFVLDCLLFVDLKSKIILEVTPIYPEADEWEISGYYAAESTSVFLEKYFHPIFPFMKDPDDHQKGRIFLFTIEHSEVRLLDFPIKQLNVDLDTMFEPPVKQFYEKINEKLGDTSGLYLLHGLPGTGKTSFLNHLIQNTPKEFIFMPAEYAKNLGKPDFIQLFFKHKKAVIIIEDADDVLRKRGTDNRSIVSNLLNITDGIMGSVLNLHVICTLNSALDEIDEALLRKGRLKAKCFFDKLETSKANALSEKLGFKSPFTEPVTLAEIFNQDEVVFGEKKREKIGF